MTDDTQTMIIHEDQPSHITALFQGGPASSYQRTYSSKDQDEKLAKMQRMIEDMKDQYI
jgi:hypothetical protein